MVEGCCETGQEERQGLSNPGALTQEQGEPTVEKNQTQSQQGPGKRPQQGPCLGDQPCTTTTHLHSHKVPLPASFTFFH